MTGERDLGSDKAHSSLPPCLASESSCHQRPCSTVELSHLLLPSLLACASSAFSCWNSQGVKRCLFHSFSSSSFFLQSKLGGRASCFAALPTSAMPANFQFSANIKVVTESAEALVGHNGRRIVNVAFSECRMRKGQGGEIFHSALASEKRIHFLLQCVALDFQRCSAPGTCH